MNVQKIAFFLPGKDSCPLGGYKVVYEYANLFAQKGYDISIIYPHVTVDYKKQYKNPLFRFKLFIGFYYRRFRKQYNPAFWFELDSRVRKEHIFCFTDKYLKKFRNTKIIATAVRTAHELNNAKTIPTENKYYFIQDFEAWGVSEEYVYNSYRFKMKKITIAPWLQERVAKTGEKAILAPNGFDFEYFKLTTPIESRKNTEIAMLYHKADRKRCADSMAAFEIVKKQIPALHITMFGAPARPSALPDWYTYHRTPDKGLHNKIYNNASIFVAASDLEGFGLTVGESMICGCAVACTDNGGFSCMVKNEDTGLLSPVYDVNALAKNILHLIQDENLRIKLAKNGNAYIQQFTWNRAFDIFERAITEEWQKNQ